MTPHVGSEGRKGTFDSTFPSAIISIHFQVEDPQKGSNSPNDSVVIVHSAFILPNTSDIHFRELIEFKELIAQICSSLSVRFPTMSVCVRHLLS